MDPQESAINTSTTTDQLLPMAALAGCRQEKQVEVVIVEVAVVVRLEVVVVVMEVVMNSKVAVEVIALATPEMLYGT
ncbi:unnamed protein product [Merluccius merluccius]